MGCAASARMASILRHYSTYIHILHVPLQRIHPHPAPLQRIHHLAMQASCSLQSLSQLTSCVTLTGGAFEGCEGKLC